MALKHIQATHLFAQDKAPRVMSTPAAAEYLRENEVSMEGGTLDRFISTMSDQGLFKRVQRNLFINGLASPRVAFDEVAQHLRAGAIVSLQRALGAYGVLNNPSRIITAVVPIDPAAPPPKLGMVETAISEFQFRGIPAHILFAGREEDRLVAYNRPFPGTAPVATPEKALIDWVYLANSARSTLTPPPLGDIDMEMLDLPRFRRLAKAAGMGPRGDEFLQQLKNASEYDWDAEANKMGLSV